MKISSKITRAFLITGLAAFLTLGASQGFAQDKGHEHQGMKMEAGKEVTLKGEVLDMFCYMEHPAKGQGPDHAKCAQSCIRKGLPIGFLSDGEVYLIIGKNHESANDLVVDYAGMQSQLTGKLIEHDGVKAIELNKIEKLPTKSGS